ncbi:MAG: helix-turn-helix transcriptional regulator [Lachnospiraceae bacterium]|nr:helix-turn-helix transcriptional regulator [Lachnospiraceae bacterium]
MKLYTECHWDGWDRIVDMTVEKSDSLTKYIKDESVYKILLHEKGEIRLIKDGETFDIRKPSLILLSHKDRISFETLKKGSNITLYMKPSVVRDEFTLEKIDANAFKEMFGQTIYQDYVLVSDFTEIEELKDRIYELSLNEAGKIKSLMNSVDKELTAQYDGFWPCRSRSYLMELLFYIANMNFHRDGEADASSSDDEIYSRIVEYLSEHLSENITLERVTGDFNINRNKLNELFLSKTSRTCLNYLAELRLDMAKIILSKTQIPIGEVSERVGYPDQNYFTKVFKKQVDMTPSQYRKKEYSCR